MAMVAAIAGLFSVLTSWFVGVRLILLSRRTRQTPELLVGVALLLLGGCWSPFVAVGRQATALPDSVRVTLVVVGALCGLAGMAAFAVFNWRVYRPQDRRAAALAAAITVAICAAFVVQSAGFGWVEYTHSERGPWLVASWLGVGIYVWATIESWQQHRMQVRRRALGLADPVVADRMRLWALCMATALVGSFMLAVCQALGIPVAGTVVGLSLSAFVASFSGGLLLLAFAPPAAYLARVRRNAGAEA